MPATLPCTRKPAPGKNGKNNETRDPAFGRAGRCSYEALLPPRQLCSSLRCRLPDLIVGDFDSAPQPDTDSDTIVLPHVKDDTDTHYAAKWLLENGYTQVTMLGALGGARLEHTIANLSTGLFLAEHGVDVVLADTASEIHYLVPGKDLTLQRGEWQYLSVFPWDGKLIGVDIEGAYYPLHGAELVPDYPLGVSNEFVEPTVTLRCQAGHGIVVLTRAD